MSYNLAEKVGFIKINKNSTRVQTQNLSFIRLLNFRQFSAIFDIIQFFIGAGGYR